MDPTRFDDITRILAGGASRRRILGGLTGAALGLLGVSRGTAQGDPCAAFCLHLPPGLRGACRSDCAKGTGLYADCEGDAGRLCPQADGTYVCCASGQTCENGSCGTPPPAGCTADIDCADGNACTQDLCDTGSGTCSNPPIEGCVPCETDLDCLDEDDCTEDLCVEGRCEHRAIPDCGQTCDCPLKADGEVCVEHDECCSGSCWLGFCGTGESFCVPVGFYCSENTCCTGLCDENCQCTCLANGDLTCASDAQCCGGLCGPDGCCGETDTRCAADADCCSGRCTYAGYEDEGGVPVYTCDRGPAGTPCRSSGECESITCCEDVCCPENHFCGYDEGTGEFRCMPWT